MLIVESKGKVICQPKPPVIGGKFVGPAKVLDTINGIVQLTMPKMSDNELRIQAILLKKK